MIVSVTLGFVWLGFVMLGYVLLGQVRLGFLLGSPWDQEKLITFTRQAFWLVYCNKDTQAFKKN